LSPNVPFDILDYIKIKMYTDGLYGTLTRSSADTVWFLFLLDVPVNIAGKTDKFVPVLN
jgi:hypothetical protein